MTELPPAPPRKGWPWGRIVLVLSLSVNLLIAGMVAGFVLRHRAGGDVGAPPPALRDIGLGPYAQLLSPEDRRELGRAIARRSADFRANEIALRQQFTELLGALRATPFDAERVRAIVAEQQERLIERQQLGLSLLMERLEAMSDDERQALADRLEKGLRRLRRP